jgi:translocation and assembly module TamB
VRQARADSARTARETEIERIVTGKPLPRFAVDTPHAIPKNAVGGSIQTSGRVRGWLGDFDVRGRAAGQNVVAKGNAAASFRSEYAVVHGRTDRASYIVGLQADSLSAFGFAFDTVDARLALSKPTGRIELVARQGNDREIGVWGNLAFHPEHSELHLSNVVFRIDTTRWTLAGPAAVQWGGTGVVVRNVDLRNPSEGRIWVDGRLPTSGSAALDVAVDELDVGSALAFAQSDVALDGRLTARGRLEGTLADPRFRGAFGLRNAHYADAQVPELRGSFAYANRSLTTNVLALQDGAQVATVNGTIPINLALSGVTGDRLGDAGVNVTVAADSLPLDLVGRVTDVVSDVKGVAAGRIAIRGALTRPALTGALAIRNGEATITATGGRLTNVFGAVRMLRDTVTIDSLVGRMGAGDVRLTGGLAVGDWREPAFNLYLVARDAEVMHGDRGRLWADAGLALTGPFKNAYLSGQATVRRGVVYIPEGRKDVLSSSDPTLFAVLDTAVMADRELLPGESPLMENLRLDVDVEIDRNTWVRSRDANVEVFSDGLLHVHRERTASGRAVPAITGVIATERGEYRLFSKRFVVKRGSAVFIGATEINPLLQATAEYEVRPAGREAINIRVVLGGTMNNPRITLESDARPPLSQTDLLSYLAFGKETTSLLDFEGSPLSSQSGNPNLVGVSRVAGRRLAGVALGVALDEAEGEAGRELGVDVFNITPEDVPTEFATSDVEAFLLGTRFEVGKYVNPRTFVQLSGSPSALRIGRGQSRIPPGARIEYRTPIGWRYEAFVEPRLRLRDPTLSSQQKPVSPLPVFGVFIIREWRF